MEQDHYEQLRIWYRDRMVERLIMCCSYYQTHSPNKYFNKYQISNWYDGHCRDERKIVEDGLSELESKYSIHFPDQIYTIDMLSYYPIIVGNFDMASESNLTDSGMFLVKNKER